MKKIIALVFGGMFVFSAFVFAAENVEAVKENESLGTQNTEINKIIDQKLEVKPAAVSAANNQKPAVVESGTIQIIKEEKKNDTEVLSNKELQITPKSIPELEVTTTEKDNESLYPAFFVMAKRGDIPVLQIFLERKLEINRTNSLGMTTLLEAVKANQEKTVKFLIKKGANANAVSNNGVNALRFAVENNNKNLVKLFLKKDVNVGEKDALGQTPLMISIEKNYYKLTKLMLDNLKGFDVDMQDKNGKSLFMAAVENNDLSLVKDLMKKNVNIWLVNNKNEDALSVAERHNNRKIINMLKNQMQEDRKKDPKVEQWLRKPGDKTNSGAK